jgi:cytochrome c5
VISFEGPTAYDAKGKKLEGRDNSFNAAIDYVEQRR